MTSRFAVFACVLLGVLTSLLAESFAQAQALPQLLGRASCASATCHGGSIDRGPTWNHSLSTWTIRDPHVNAAILLHEDASRHIVALLDPTAVDNPERYDNVLRARCISCHATASPIDCEQRGLLDPKMLAEGVSCEACHGPAENWIDSHVGVDWLGPERFDPSTGMRDTESIIGRADTCVRCHIGSRSADGLVRDMNHDLIASGHPALRFDLLLYNESLPAHWDPSSPPELEFGASAQRVRAVARAINLSAAAKLAGERAAGHLKNANVPWPELAEYDCFACHQALSDREYLLPPSEVKKPTLHISDGLPLWNSWYSIEQLPRWKQLLEALSPHRSDPARVAQSIGVSVVQPQREVAVRALSAKQDANSSLSKALSKLESDGVLDWHEAAILYLDLDAMLRDQAKLPGQTKAALERRQRLLEIVEPSLRFTRSQASDAGSSKSTVYQSPARFDAKEFRTAVRTALPNATDTGAPNSNNPNSDNPNSGNQANLTSQP